MAATTTWKGSITFGLVNIGIGLTKALDDDTPGVELHQYDSSNNSRIRQKRVSEADGSEVPYERVRRGFQTSDNKIVLIDDAELEQLSSNKTVELVASIPRRDLDPILYDEAYYVTPTPTSEKAFSLLFWALTQAERPSVLIGKITLRTRPRMVAFMAHQMGTRLVVRMHTLRWAESVRPSIDAPVVEFRDEELELASKLVASLDGRINFADFTDPHAENMRSYIASKLAGDETLDPQPIAEVEAPTDLMAALEASVAQAKADRASS